MTKENLYEDEENSRKRENVLKELEKIVNVWVKEASKDAKNSSHHEIDVDNCQAKIFTFGSYKLGVHSPGSDIDALCVAPKHIDRSLFFDSLLNNLRSNNKIEEINPIQDALVPIIKMKFDSVEIDLL